jgi:26S proteasome regulatory subunit N10
MRLTQTNECGELFNCIMNIPINGDADMLTAIKIAQLSLKHRQNKSQRQRIVVFVGHPIRGTEDDFEDVGMRLKKNNVAIDVINFANPDNIGRLQAIVNTANSGNEAESNCHFLDVPEGCSNITDVMITSPVLQSDDMGGAAVGGDVGGGGAGGAGIPGLDPNMDPELAEAIRLSLEEANAAQANNNPPEPAPV